MKTFSYFLQHVVVVFMTVSLCGCPATFKVEIQNDTDEIIHILSGYSDVVLLDIEPGKSGKVAYNFDCFRVKASTHLFEFKPVMPSEEFVTNGLFSSSLKAVFTANKRFRIYSDEQEIQEDLYLTQGCD
ncbi:MAG: hypothetical protein MI976_15020 [Pseudomonadales bacterium]|nr:hypothetical protein [Pseudomonadales bacterium]